MQKVIMHSHCFWKGLKEWARHICTGFFENPFLVFLELWFTECGPQCPSRWSAAQSLVELVFLM